MRKYRFLISCLHSRELFDALLNSMSRSARRGWCCQRSLPEFLAVYPDTRLEVIAEEIFVDVRGR